MHVFITGGSGLTGPAVVAELIAAGHAVTGLARSDDAAARLEKLGAQALRGSLEDTGRLEEGARAADGVIHMAFGGSFGDPESLVNRDVSAIQALGRALAGSGKPFVSTSGTLVMAADQVSTEEDVPDPGSLARDPPAGRGPPLSAWPWSRPRRAVPCTAPARARSPCRPSPTSSGGYCGFPSPH